MYHYSPTWGLVWKARILKSSGSFFFIASRVPWSYFSEEQKALLIHFILMDFWSLIYWPSRLNITSHSFRQRVPHLYIKPERSCCHCQHTCMGNLEAHQPLQPINCTLLEKTVKHTTFLLLGDPHTYSAGHWKSEKSVHVWTWTHIINHLLTTTGNWDNC